MDAGDLAAWLDGDGGKAEVVADLQGAMDREISAVPTFVIDDRFMVPGAQDVEVFVNVLERILAK
jgi:predicted DsbA family dithiol-disulfide isomerase